MMMRIVCIAVFVFSAFRPIAVADSWGPIEKLEFYSDNRSHLLKIAPHEDWPDKPGHCRATLYRVIGDERVELWSRFLINDHAPVRVFVSDSGEYVLTMDEWHSVGELPVVIYGPRGELIRVHSTESLGLKDDIDHIDISVSSYWWNEDSISFFGPNDEMFFIRLHWGNSIVLEMHSGELVAKKQTFFREDLRKLHEQKWNELDRYRRATLAAHATRMLSSEEADERKTGALICGQERLTHAIPDLKRLLTDRAWFTQNSTIVLYVRKAAKNALESMGQRVDNVVTKLPEHGHLRYDPAVSKYVVDIEGQASEESIEPRIAPEQRIKR